MNFENIFTAILTSSLVGLVVGYILNRRLEAARLRFGEEIRPAARKNKMCRRTDRDKFR